MDKLGPGYIFENRFEILGFLGGGGMGAVYKAKQLDANRIVALKLLHHSLVETEEFQKRFLRECKLLSRLSSEQIITFYHAAISADGNPYAVFEYLEGQTLRQILDARERLSVSESLTVFIQVSAAMQAAHALDIVHRDLKPENIMMSQQADSWSIKVFDFGLSKESITEERESQKLTLTGDVVGTAAYMSPEQCSGGRADARSDIYALGCIAYECLSGKQLFDEVSPMAALHKHLNEDPRDAVNELCAFCPPALTGLIMNMLAKSPAARPRSMAAVRDALLKAETQLQQGITSSKVVGRKRHRFVLIGACALLILLAGAGAFMFYMMREQSIQNAKLEEDRKRSRLAAKEKRNFIIGSELVDSAGQAIETQNFPDAIKFASECLSLKNDTCEYVPIKLRALQILTQASDFSGLANSDPPLFRMRDLLRESQTRNCLSDSEQAEWTFSYLILAANVNANKGRLRQTIEASLEFERLHKLVPDDQKVPHKLFLSLVSRGNAYRNTRQFQKAFETDRRALQLAKDLEAEGADELHSIYPSILIDCCVINEDPKKTAQFQAEYAEAFEKSFSSANSEGMMRTILTIQDYVLSNPNYVDGATPLILKGWKAAEMFPELSTNLRLRALQQLLRLRQRQAAGGKLSSKDLSEIATSYLRVLKEAQSPSLGKEFKTCRQELAQELERLLVSDGQASLAAKVKKAFESFRLDA